MRDEGRYLYNQVDSDVKWEWSEGGLAASDAVSSYFPLPIPKNKGEMERERANGEGWWRL